MSSTKIHIFPISTIKKSTSLTSQQVNKCGKLGFSGKFLGIDYALLPNREWNQKQKHKKQPWSNVECFAFGRATVRFASLETSFHAANRTIPPPPSYEVGGITKKKKTDRHQLKTQPRKDEKNKLQQ